MGFYRAPESDTSYSEDVFAEASDNQRFRPCVACGARTTHTNVRAQTGSYTEYNNVLVMNLDGGYGLFFDDSPLTVVICHDCAHDICINVPWLGRLIDPYRAHSHTQLYHEANPDHFGWDYLNRERDDRMHSFFSSKACPTCSHPPSEHAYNNPDEGFPCYVCDDHTFCPLPSGPDL